MKIRCYLPSSEWEKRPVSVSGPEAHHLVNVLRVSPGMEVTCFDGRGREALARVQQVGKKGILLELQGDKAIVPLAYQVDLGIAVPGHGILDQIVNQSTQMGVARIIPLSTSRVVVKMTPSEFAKKQNRLDKIIIEAGKQSGVSLLPSVAPLTSWPECLRLFGNYDVVLIGAVEGPHEDIKELLSERKIRRVLLLIGPEGDFTLEEVAQAVQAGAHRISLGKTVLRCDTAVVAALSLISFFLR